MILAALPRAPACATAACDAPWTRLRIIVESLDNLYQGLAPWAEALLRAAVGLALVPHGLRNTFGFFPKTGVRSHNLAELAKQLDEDGYHPGRVWAPAISVTQLVFAPMLAAGALPPPRAGPPLR